MTTDATVQLDITGTWERAAVSRHGVSTTLMLTIGASTTQSPRDADRLPVDLALAIDRSGSMAGDKLELVKRATLEAVGHLGPRDTFSVVLFDTEVDVLMPLMLATGDNRDRLGSLLRDVDAGSMTCLSGGWLTGCELLGERMGGDTTPHLRRVVLLTDGLANIGIIDPHHLMTHAGALRERGIITSTMGVGYGFDEVLLGGMAEAGGGNFRYVGAPDELSAFFRNEIGGLLDVVAQQPKLRITFPPGMRGELVNQFPVHRIGKEVTVDLADLRADDTIALIFDISVRPGEVGTTFQPTLLVEAPHRPDIVTLVNQSVETLTRVRARDLGQYDVRPDVQRRSAQIHADRNHREALRLDREGRFEDARVLHGQARSALFAAPDSPEIIAERTEAEYLYRSVGQLSEHDRKDRVSRAMHRSRGSRPGQ